MLIVIAILLLLNLLILWRMMHAVTVNQVRMAASQDRANSEMIVLLRAIGKE